MGLGFVCEGLVEVHMRPPKRMPRVNTTTLRRRKGQAAGLRIVTPRRQVDPNKENCWDGHSSLWTTRPANPTHTFQVVSLATDRTESWRELTLKVSQLGHVRVVVMRGAGSIHARLRQLSSSSWD